MCTKILQRLRVKVIFGAPYILWEVSPYNLATALAILNKLLRASVPWDCSPEQDETL